MTGEYTATDINSVYESLKRKLSIRCSQPKRLTPLNHCTDLCIQSATIAGNQPSSCLHRRAPSKMWRRDDRTDRLFESWQVKRIVEVIYNCTQPHDAWSILGQPLAAFAHHASILQANLGCKLCTHTTCSNDGLMPKACPVCSLLTNSVDMRLK